MIRYRHIAVFALVMVLVAGCIENKREPLQIVKSTRQLGGRQVNTDSSDNTVLEVLYFTDSNNVTEKIEVTVRMKKALIKLINDAIALNYSEKADRILNMKDYETAERMLLDNLNDIARECGFRDFRSANRVIDRIRDYPEIAQLLNKLDEIENAGCKKQYQ